MHGYIDSFTVPVKVHSIQSGATTATNSSKSNKAKGKEKDTSASSGPGHASTYDVVANWSSQERDQVERKVLMAAKRE